MQSSFFKDLLYLKVRRGQPPDEAQATRATRACLGQDHGARHYNVEEWLAVVV